MKKILIATAVALSLSAAAQAAESTAVLKVTGVLTNDACTPELDGGGVVDFGTKYINELSATETNQLGTKDLNLTISCTTPTKVSWSVNDDRTDSMVRLTITNGAWVGDETAWGSDQLFGVGKTAGGVSIGLMPLISMKMHQRLMAKYQRYLQRLVLKATIGMNSQRPLPIPRMDKNTPLEQ